MARALAEGTEDGRLFLHAAVIAAADGRPADAARWAAQGAHAPLHAASLRARGAPEGNRATTPMHEVIEMKKLRRDAAADRCSGTAAVPATGAGIQPHGCAAHHAGRCGEHDRRVCVRLPAVRPQVPDDRARRLPARGAGHRPEQVQLRRRRPLRDPRRDRKRRREGAHDVRLSVQVRHDLQEPQHDPAVVPRRDRQRRRRVAEPRSSGTPSTRSTGAPGRRRASGAASCRPTTRATPRRNTTATTTASSRPGTAWPTRATWIVYTSQSIAELEDGYLAFAGQRDDGFYADIQADLRSAEAARRRARPWIRRAGSTSTRSPSTSRSRRSAATSRSSASMPRPAGVASRSSAPTGRREAR